MSKKVLIVGGVAGGASTAARLRRMDENSEIIMFERGEYISFANCGLPYYIGGTIEERNALLLQTPEAMNARFNIDVRVNNEVLSINKDKKEVIVKDLKENKEYRESYDVLVLSPGSTPLRPPIKGIDASNIFTLWNIPDTDRIKGYVDEKKPKRATVIGGGFIGLEMAENLHDRGLDVSIVEMADQVMAPIDYEMAQIAHNHIRSKDVNLVLEDGVKEFKQNNDGSTTVVLQSGKEIVSDIIILSIGIRPNSSLAKVADLEMNKRGGIIVDEYLRTSDKSIYALGDAIEVIDFNTKDKTMVPLAGPANKQGRIAANNIAGREEAYKGTQGTSIAKVFDLTVANTGINEKTLKRNGKRYREDYFTSIIHSKSNAGYYPGAIPMTIKLIFDKDGKVLGSQIVGYTGVDKRIDVLATAIRFNSTVYDLKELELAYAPPYSSAKDPVNMAGFTAENILKGDVDVIHWHEMKDLDMDKTIILDVREAIERELGYVKGSINIEVNELRNRLDELDKDKLIVIYCAIGVRGYIATRILKQNGFNNVKNLSGGYTTYSCMFCQEDGDMCGGHTCDAEVEYDEAGNPEHIEDIHQEEIGETVKLNACGLQCPGPIMQVFKKMKEMKDGDVLEVEATDPGFMSDIKTWCKRTGNTLISTEKRDKSFAAIIRKGVKNKPTTAPVANPREDKSMVVFSGDLDKAIASFIIANGAAAMGRKVTMFFTFWGLNVLRKHDKINVNKGFMDKMFGAMMPRGSRRLGLSRMNMAGMGSKMIRRVMQDKNIDSLEDLILKAQENGVRIVACAMSMDVMGITEEELIDGVEMGGVANYLGAAEESDVNLFI
ncbi:DsrE/DsrF/DrsH-like family protein [Clostridium sp. D2Q-11]|uniref:DsrE/DsrF/DrsH-like family protein n=1 Tax=Anaeromonas frigoriresistens TaxID=2683708 RepID=A0A942USC0_9FIRM|nr:DsrE/DsrF/DrsH-like family protein [Anaeromonas frigoriresistens]MBS4538263.1 DsrE/DsrF/DrsH-like family protein [Anaeromonas frigoriresistens]